MNHKTKDILERIEDSSPNESSHELICRLRDCAHEIETLRAALACRPDAQADERGAWKIGAPPVPKGECREFIVAVRRAQSKPPGKVFVFSANYANKFTDDGCLSDRDGDEFVADGWHLCGLDMSGEFNEVYEPIGLNEGDEILGWKELPKWDEDRAAAQDDERRKKIEAAIKTTEYKYFGMYEFDESQHDAVDVLVSAARDFLSRAAAPQAEAAQGVPEGWTGNHEANSALIMLDRLDVSSDDDVRVDAISAIVRKLAAAPAPVSAPSLDHEQVGEAEKLFACAAQKQGTAGGNEPAECDWPMCGCDEHATRVIESLQESGHLRDAPPSRECGEPSRPLSDFERIVLEYIAFNDGFINTRIKARQMLDGGHAERRECHHGQDDGACGWCYDEKAASAPTLGDDKLREMTLRYCAFEAETASYNPLKFECEEDLFSLIRESSTPTLSAQPQAAEPKALYFKRSPFRGGWTTFNIRDEDADEAERRLLANGE